MSGKISVLAVLLFSFMAVSCDPQDAPFDPQQWVGTYEAVDPTCVTTIKFSIGGEEVSARYVSIAYKTLTDMDWTSQLTISASAVPLSESKPWVEKYYNLNGTSYISGNSCILNGKISRTTVVATAGMIAAKTEQMDHDLICRPTIPLSSTDKEIAERNGDTLSIYGCKFSRMTGFNLN